MKTNRIFAIAVVTVVAGAVLAGCGGSKQAGTSSKTSAGNPFGESYEMPCTVFDDAENFAATGTANGAASRRGSLQLAALKNAQDVVAMKMKHAVQGEVKTFFEGVGSTKGTDVDDQTIGAIDNIIMGIVNDTEASCLKWTATDDKGNTECYTSIKVSKSKIADAVADNLSKNQKAEIRQRAEEFRKQVKEDLKSYSE